MDFFGNRIKIYTNTSDFIGYQVIGTTRSEPILLMGTIGTKNSSLWPCNYKMNQIQEGNEYLPACVQIQDKISYEPVASVTNPSNFVVYTPNLVQQCLVLPGNPSVGGRTTYLYGYFSDTGLNGDSVGNGPYFVAAQGQNIGGLLTPQAERAFDEPMDSATVVEILTIINAAEALSNTCHAASTPTHWMANVQEWVKSDSGTITLNFFPVSMTPNVYDAWAKTAYSAATYTAPTKTFTINPTTAPSQLIVSNQVYLGCDAEFTNSYGGIVPALTANTLAGVPINEAFLTQIRTALAGILHKYQTNTACVACGGYDLPTALHAAGISNDTWSTIVGGLILSSHITELQKVLSVLTTELHCCCSNVIITLSPSSASATDTNALPDGSSNVVYSTTITAGGTDCPHYKFTVASGSSLPPDLILTNLTDTSAAIIGTPTTVGSNTFVITVTETNGCSTNQTYSIAINSWSGTALCDCPCWPPNTCPSGSLAQTYIVTAWHQLYKFDPLNWNECKLTAPTVVTASTDWYDHCHWQAGSISELPTAPIACRSTTDGGVTWSDWSTGLTYLDAGIPGCGWIVAMTGTAPYGATKQTGLTPIGSYSRSDVFAEATATVTVSPPSASSAGEGIGPVAPGRALR